MVWSQKSLLGNMKTLEAGSDSLVNLFNDGLALISLDMCVNLSFAISWQEDLHSCLWLVAIRARNSANPNLTGSRAYVSTSLVALKASIEALG